MKKKQPTDSFENTSGLTDEEIKIRAEQRKRAERKKRKKMIKTAIIVLVFVAIALVVFSWFMKIKKAEKESENLVTYTVSRRDIEEVLSATGTLQPADSYTVSASAQGDILQCLFEEGDEVKEDDILYVIDSSNMDSTRRQREMSLENALEDYNDLVSDREKLNTYSKYGGTITKLYIEEGDTVREDQVIADIIDRETMLIDLAFFEVDVLTMKTGDKMSVVISGTGESLPGTVEKISALTGVSSTGVITRDVTISVKNPGGITKSTEARAQYTNDITSLGSSAFYYNVEEQILAAYGGDVKKVAVSEGQNISKGSFVMCLDGKNLEKSIKQASQSLENAQLSYDNTMESIENYTIKAPITGTVIEKYYNAGESIDNTGGSKTVAIIYDLSSLKFDMNIDELDIFSIEKGQEVTITSDAYSGKKFKGEITKISKVGSTSSGTTVYPVTVTISDEEALLALLPGMNIDAEIIINKSENVLAVPTGAVQRGNTVKVIKNSEGVKSKPANTQFPDGTGMREFSADGKDLTFNGEFPADIKRPETGEIPAGVIGESTDKTTDLPIQSETASRRPLGNAGAGAAVYGTAPGDTEYEVIKVETGVSDDDFIEIVSGLSEGDIVIIEQNQVSSSGFGMMGMSGMKGGMPSGGMMGGMPSGGMMSGGMPSGAMGGNRPSGGMPGGR